MKYIKNDHIILQKQMIFSVYLLLTCRTRRDLQNALPIDDNKVNSGIFLHQRWGKNIYFCHCWLSEMFHYTLMYVYLCISYCFL